MSSRLSGKLRQSCQPPFLAVAWEERWIDELRSTSHVVVDVECRCDLLVEAWEGVLGQFGLSTLVWPWELCVLEWR